MIKPLKKPLWTLDSETDPFKKKRLPYPFIWGAYDGKKYHEFTTPTQVADFFGPRKAVVYAHNGGKFDYHFLLDFINREKTIKIINGRLALFYIGECEFRDSYNILPVPLSAYKKDDINYDIFEADEREKPKNKKEIKKYLKADCVYLHEIVTRFIDEFGFELTQASASMAAWERMAQKTRPRSNQDYYEKLAPYYYGGRVQCFEQGVIKTDFQVRDIRSAYPYAMTHLHPMSTNHFEGTQLPPKDYIGPTLITLECISHGALPFRHKEKSVSKLYFPNDNVMREYHVTGWEYLAGLETKTIKNVKIKKVIMFSALDHFTDYINTFYNKRLEADKVGDAAGKLLYKLFMNGLYGKFASNPDKYCDYKLFEAHEFFSMEESGFTQAGMLGPWALGEKPLEEHKKNFYNIATSASITGFVRAFLWRGIHACKRPLYCDTDAIAGAGLDHLPIGKELGKWSLEGNFTHAYIGGKKLYAFKYADKDEYKIATKGVRLEASEIIDVAQGAVVEFEPITPTYSVHGAPGFVTRRVRATAQDMSKLPEIVS